MTPLAYAYPYGDFGQFESRNAFARRLNLNLASKYFGLGFLLDRFCCRVRSVFRYDLTLVQWHHGRSVKSLYAC